MSWRRPTPLKTTPMVYTDCKFGNVTAWLRLDGRTYESKPFPRSGGFATEKAVAHLAKTVVRSMISQRQYVFDELVRRGHVIDAGKVSSLTRLHDINSLWGPIQRWNRMQPLLKSAICFLWDIMPGSQSPFRNNYVRKVDFLQGLVLDYPENHVFEEKKIVPEARQMELFETV